MPKAFGRLTVILSPPCYKRAVIPEGVLSPATYTKEQTQVPVSKLLVPSLTASLSPPPWVGWGEKPPQLGFRPSLPRRMPRGMLHLQHLLPCPGCSWCPPASEGREGMSWARGWTGFGSFRRHSNPHTCAERGSAPGEPPGTAGPVSGRGKIPQNLCGAVTCRAPGRAPRQGELLPAVSAAGMRGENPWLCLPWERFQPC